MFETIKKMIYKDSSPGWIEGYYWQTCPKCGCKYVIPTWHEGACTQSSRGQRRVIGVTEGEHMHLKCAYPYGGHCGYEWGVPPRYFTQEQLEEFGLT